VRLEGSRCKARSEDVLAGALFWKLTFTVTFVTAYRGQSLRHHKLELDLELHVLVIDDA
jgi:hypothetical protein